MAGTPLREGITVRKKDCEHIEYNSEFLWEGADAEQVAGNHPDRIM